MTLNGPQSSPLMQLLNWIFRPLDFLEECDRKYGDMFNLNLMGLPPFTVVSNPQGIEEILSVDAKKFDVGRNNELAAGLLGDNSLVLLDGEPHRRQRMIYLTHHREDLYPEPKQFKPERFLERQYTTYEFLPFGGGNRRCIGYALALLEMKLVLAKILTRWDLSLTSDRPILPQRRGATVAPNNGVPLTVNSKRDPIERSMATAERI
ncbi:MAG: cytochrome P450 [Cyanobacteria bacterium P01_G01_bin.39]